MTLLSKQLFIEGKKLVKEGKVYTFRIAQIVRDIFSDESFISDDCKGERSRGYELLDELTEACPYDSYTLIQMIDMFPDKSRWIQTRLSVLHDEMCQSVLRRRKEASVHYDKKNGFVPATGSAPPVTPSASQAESQEERRIRLLENKLREAELEITSLKNRIKELEDQAITDKEEKKAISRERNRFKDQFTEASRELRRLRGGDAKRKFVGAK